MQIARIESGSTALAATVAKAEHYILNARSKNTVKAYRSDWRHFAGWCEMHGLDFLPAVPETVALYLADLAASRRPSTIRRRLTAITKSFAFDPDFSFSIARCFAWFDINDHWALLMMKVRYNHYYDYLCYFSFCSKTLEMVSTKFFLLLPAQEHQEMIRSCIVQ